MATARLALDVHLSKALGRLAQAASAKIRILVRGPVVRRGVRKSAASGGERVRLLP
jgi:hypothetical protein